MTASIRLMRRLGMAALTTLALSLSLTGGTVAHGPDPFFGGGPFGQDQQLRYRWRSGAEPAATIKTAIRAAAEDANATRASKAATFVYDSTGANPIGYGVAAPCGVNGLACFTRDAPNGFTMWLREQGHVFDWGTLKWCQTYSTPPNGCYDAETISLDEFGHVEGLSHHVNKADDSDYGDAVVQTYSRTKPAAFYNMHVFGRCDVAMLQLQYDVATASSKYSTCLDVATVLTIGASPTSIVVGASTTLTATLKVAKDDDYLRLSSNPLSGRTVILQRRPPGTTAWTNVATMTPNASGTYILAQRPSTSTEYRAVFKTPSDEGINGDSSPVVKVTVARCATIADGAASIADPCV